MLTFVRLTCPSLSLPVSLFLFAHLSLHVHCGWLPGVMQPCVSCFRLGDGASRALRIYHCQMFSYRFMAFCRNLNLLLQWSGKTYELWIVYWTHSHAQASRVKNAKSKGDGAQGKKCCLHLSAIHKSVCEKVLPTFERSFKCGHKPKRRQMTAHTTHTNTRTHVKCKNQLQSQPTKRVAARNLPGHFCGCHRQCQ